MSLRLCEGKACSQQCIAAFVYDIPHSVAAVSKIISRFQSASWKRRYDMRSKLSFVLPAVLVSTLLQPRHEVCDIPCLLAVRTPVDSSQC
jgi:hypothetical protein